MLEPFGSITAGASIDSNASNPRIGNPSESGTGTNDRRQVIDHESSEVICDDGVAKSHSTPNAKQPRQLFRQRRGYREFRRRRRSSIRHPSAIHDANSAFQRILFNPPLAWHTALTSHRSSDAGSWIHTPLACPASASSQTCSAVPNPPLALDAAARLRRHSSFRAPVIALKRRLGFTLQKAPESLSATSL